MFADAAAGGCATSSTTAAASRRRSPGPSRSSARSCCRGSASWRSRAWTYSRSVRCFVSYALDGFATVRCEGSRGGRVSEFGSLGCVALCQRLECQQLLAHHHEVAEGKHLAVSAAPRRPPGASNRTRATRRVIPSLGMTAYVTAVRRLTSVMCWSWAKDVSEKIDMKRCPSSRCSIPHASSRGLLRPRWSIRS